MGANRNSVIWGFVQNPTRKGTPIRTPKAHHYAQDADRGRCGKRRTEAEALHAFLVPGFTLIEIIVSISIITVLIAILIPTLPLAFNAARRTKCAANLRSIGQAVELYKNEFKEALPLARYMPPPWLSADVAPPLNVVLTKYFEAATPAYRCPGDRIVHATEYKDPSGTPRTTGVSYTYLSELGGRPYDRAFYFTKFGLSPSETPLAHDFDGGTFETQTGEFVSVDFFHDVRNLLFIDGHVGRFE